MDEKFLEHVYDPFERADDERVKNIQGTGLGMSIVKGLVSMMQGDVQVRSVPGKGTRFTVTLYLKLENREEISEKKKQTDLSQIFCCSCSHMKSKIVINHL